LIIIIRRIDKGRRTGDRVAASRHRAAKGRGDTIKQRVIFANCAACLFNADDVTGDDRVGERHRSSIDIDRRPILYGWVGKRVVQQRDAAGWLISIGVKYIALVAQ